MQAKPYPAEKQKLLASMSGDKLLAFALEVNQGLLKPWASRLKPITGFRAGSAAEIERRVKQYLKARGKWSEGDWSLFEDLFGRWVRSHADLDKALKAFDNSADFGPNAAPPNTQLDIQCFDHLAAASAAGTISRETIMKFYDFGHFIPDQHVLELIRLTRSEADLRLPREVEAVKAHLAELGDKQDKNLNLMQRVIDKDIKGRIDKVEKSIDEFVRLLAVDKGTRERVSDRLQALAEDVSAVRKQSQQREAEMRKAMAQQAEQREAEMRNEMAQQAEQREAEMRKEMAQQVEQRLTVFAEQLIAVKDSVNRLHADTTTRPVETPSGAAGVSADSLSLTLATVQPAVAMEFDRTSDQLAGEPFTDIQLVIQTLTDNFRCAGLKRAEAHPLAAEVVACLLAGQVAMFRGSLASVLIEIAARTLSCAARYQVQIPVGLMDGRSFRPLLDQVVGEAHSSGQMTALVIEGINLSALEVYGRSLRRLVSDRLVRLQDNNRTLLLFATVVDGAGALPITPEFCELGPLLETDCLSTKDLWTRQSIVDGTVDPDAWLHWTGALDEKPDGWDDAIDILSSLGGSLSPLWRRALFTAYSTLWSPETPPNYWPTPVQSIAFGWVIPWLMVQGADMDHFNEIINDGLLDGDRADVRIVRLIGSEGAEG